MLGRIRSCSSRFPAPALQRWVRCASYEQGRYRDHRTREYFYYIDHQGQLFMDDAKLKNFITCFKDRKFLEFFFKRVKLNNTGFYESAFPYVSPCGREINYIHCDDLPAVFSHLVTSDGTVIQDIASYGEEVVDDDEEEKVMEGEDGGRGVLFGKGGGTEARGDHEEVCGVRDTQVEVRGSKGEGEEEEEEKKKSENIQQILTDSKTRANENSELAQEHVQVPTPPSKLATTVRTNTKSVPLPATSGCRLAYGGTLSLTVPFEPNKLCMLPSSGRVYHPGPPALGGVGLVKSSLAIELSRFFTYKEAGVEKQLEVGAQGGEEVGRGEEDGGHPVGFRWRGRLLVLDRVVLDRLADIHANVPTPKPRY